MMTGMFRLLPVCLLVHDTCVTLSLEGGWRRKICLPLVYRGVYFWREYCLHFHVKEINRSSFRKDKHGPLHFVSQNNKTRLPFLGHKGQGHWVMFDYLIVSLMQRLMQSFGFHLTHISSRDSGIFYLKTLRLYSWKWTISLFHSYKILKRKILFIFLYL